MVLRNNHAPVELQTTFVRSQDVTIVTAVSSTEHNETVWNSLKHVFTDPYFAPLMAKDLTGLPQALVYTVAQDILRDEGTLYATRLKEAGNQVEHYHNKGGFHALNSWGLPFHHRVKEDAKRSNTKIRNFIKNNL